MGGLSVDYAGLSEHSRSDGRVWQKNYNLKSFKYFLLPSATWICDENIYLLEFINRTLNKCTESLIFILK